MAKQNSIGSEFTNNPDGFDHSGGTIKRKMAIAGANITLVGSGSTIFTFPTETDTLVGVDATQTLSNKSFILTVADDDVNAGTSGVTTNELYQLSGNDTGTFSGLTGVVMIKQ